MAETESAVYVVDDDPSVQAALKKLLSLVGLHVQVFGSIADFLGCERREVPSCLVLDVRLPGMSGLDFQDQLVRSGVRLPIIFITAQGDSPMTRRAMRAGAVDFLTKPFRKKELLEAIHQALDLDRGRRILEAEISELKGRFENLTPREREVLSLVTEGQLNKQIAAKLSLSEASIKFHRGNLMKKMQAESVAELVRMVDRLKTAHS